MRIRRLPTGLLTFIGLAVLFVACDAGQTVHYKNKTNEALFVRVNAGALDRLSPGKKIDAGYLAPQIGSGDDPLHILIVDERGCTALDIHTTVAQFRKDYDFSLVINESDIPQPTARAPCDPKLADIAARTQE